MKNQELKDLLILLRDYMVENWDSVIPYGIKLNGICQACYYMQLNSSITYVQHEALMKFLDEELPKRKYQLERLLNGEFITVKGDAFCWKPFSLKPRLNWLDKQIKKLEHE